MHEPECHEMATTVAGRPAPEVDRADLARQVADLHSNAPDVVSLTLNPCTFEWIDGFRGGMRTLRPNMLATRLDGSRTFVLALGREALSADPELDGRRRHVEAECLARDATLEIWTELEADTVSRRLAVPAAGADRTAYAARTGHASGKVPTVVSSIAERLGLHAPTKSGSAWVGRCRLTGIPMAILGGAYVEPVTGAVVWHPHCPRRIGWSAAAVAATKKGAAERIFASVGDRLAARDRGRDARS